MDRIFRLLPKKHTAFRAFAHDFSEAIFLRDRDDEARVQAVLESKGINWDYA
jgi:predicted mannosyl-3-phosphoglycerate phosphatase (HAD superfamily)